MDRLKKVLNGVAQHKDAVVAAAVPVLLAIVLFVHGDMKGTITNAESRLAGKLDKVEDRLKEQVSGVTGELVKVEDRLKEQVSGVVDELARAEGRLKGDGQQVATSKAFGDISARMARLEGMLTGSGVEQAKNEVGDVSKE